MVADKRFKTISTVNIHNEVFIFIAGVFVNGEHEKKTAAPKNAKWDYVKKVKLFFGTIFIVSDQFYDIVLFISLLIWKVFWFATVFLLVDLLPAAFIIWQKLKYFLFIIFC